MILYYTIMHVLYDNILYYIYVSETLSDVHACHTVEIKDLNITCHSLYIGQNVSHWLLCWICLIIKVLNVDNSCFRVVHGIIYDGSCYRLVTHTADSYRMVHATYYIYRMVRFKQTAI